IHPKIRDLVEQTPIVDTHEHLIEEKIRLTGTPGWHLFPCDDWACLFSHYLSDDLASAGMSGGDLKRFLTPDVPTKAKHRLFAPGWERAKHPGYGQAVRHTLRGLYGEEDLTEASAPRLAEKYRALVRPGFYREILRDRSNLVCCQVNSLMAIFTETEYPDL